MKLLVTAGPTREPIDPVRFISNRSSGKMGYAIAQAAIDAGHEVILVTGPVCLHPPELARVVRITTCDEMFDAVQLHIEEADVLVMSAAPADYKSANYSAQKIKKRDSLMQIALEPTRDILTSIERPQKKIDIVGFAAETESLAENARKKLREKNCDLVIGNDVSRMDTGLESDDNEVTLFYKSGEIVTLPREKKTALAKKLVIIFEQLAKNR